jgi:transposase
MEEQKLRRDRIERNYQPDSFKRQLIEEYLSTDLSRYQIEQKYGIKKHGALIAWMKCLGYSDSDKNAVNLEAIKQKELAKKEIIKSSQTVELEMKIRLLEKQLEDERLRSEMLNRMVDLAEKTYKIPVRKNFSTK